MSIASILTREADWRGVASGHAAASIRLLRRCLQKDVKRRLPHIGVARLEIEEGARRAERRFRCGARRPTPA